ncbi:hypothetical protein B0H14DRAFT_3516988 [Mycena olivaceomarginata]|nr:hypothetical protein B0H14DRAFT_3516988 [Mycena olivaceomarginata]
MARTKKRNKHLQDAKAAASDPGDAGADPPKLRLTILLPKKAKNTVTSPEPEGSQSAAETITPPPVLSPKTLKKGLTQYLRSRGRSVSLEAADDDDASETELLMRAKSRTFENGVEGIDEDSEGADAEEEEDELESDEDDEEKAASDESNSESGLPTPEASPEPVPEVEKKRKKAVPEVKMKKGSVPDVLKISVPIDGANSTLTVPRTISFQELLTKLANLMSLAPNKVRVAYRFSTQARGDAFNHLASDDEWKELLAAAVKTQKVSKSQKTFIVELKDLAAAAVGKGKTKGVRESKKKKRKHESDSGDASDTNSDARDGKKKKMSGPQWVARLETSNACKECGGPCLKYASGHVRLSRQDLTTWSIFMLNGYQSETTPPPKVKIGKPQKDAETPIALPGALVAPTLPAASASNPLMPGLPYGMPPFAPWWMNTYQMPAPPPKSRYDNIPSSDPIEDVEDVTLFPRITPWLRELDNGPRGHDGHDFSQFAPEFEREKYMRVVDLMDLNVGRLTALAPEMAHGTASKLLSYASQDVECIRRKEMKRARRENNRYL